MKKKYNRIVQFAGLCYLHGKPKLHDIFEGVDKHVSGLTEGQMQKSMSLIRWRLNCKPKYVNPKLMFQNIEGTMCRQTDGHIQNRNQHTL